MIKYAGRTMCSHNVRTYARNVMDAQHVRVSDFVGPIATRLRA